MLLNTSLTSPIGTEVMEKGTEPEERKAGRKIQMNGKIHMTDSPKEASTGVGELHLTTLSLPPLQSVPLHVKSIVNGRRSVHPTALYVRSMRECLWLGVNCGPRRRVPCWYNGRMTWYQQQENRMLGGKELQSLLIDR